MRIDKCVVSIEDWQMQSSGKPFKVGDRIEWSVWKQSNNPEEYADDVDFIYENFGITVPYKIFRLSGIVLEIKSEYYRTEVQLIDEEVPVDKLIYEKSYNITEANGKDKDKDGLRFASYRIALQDCILLPEKY